MDSLTQIVLGGAVGEAVLGKKVGSRAILWGAIAGTIPDLDVLFDRFTDQITAIELHRGFSHSIIFCILLAPILGWLVQKIHKNRLPSRKEWSWLFFWSLVTHPLLDAHTTWGTQLFWPFEYRVAYKNIFVIDPLYTIPFLVLLIIAMFHKRDNPRRRKFNNAGLIVSSSYMVLTLILKWVTYDKFQDAIVREKIEYVEMDTKTTPLNSILWNAQVATKDGYKFAYFSLFDSQEVRFSREWPKNEHLIDTLRDQKVMQQLLKITEGWYLVEQTEEKLLFYDIRFGQLGVDPDSSPFLFCYDLKLDDNGVLQAKRLDMSYEDAGDVLSELWKRIKGN